MNQETPMAQGPVDVNVSQRKPFQFEQIDGFLHLDEATEQLVHVAKCMQQTHTLSSARNSKATIRHIFKMRKASITALLDLIEQYVEQMPDPDADDNTMANV